MHVTAHRSAETRSQASASLHYNYKVNYKADIIDEYVYTKLLTDT